VLQVVQRPPRRRDRPPRPATRRPIEVGRYYDPQTGQFLTIDPLVDESRASYTYAGDEPVDAIDPNGTKWFFQRAYDAVTSGRDEASFWTGVANGGLLLIQSTGASGVGQQAPPPVQISNSYSCPNNGFYQAGQLVGGLLGGYLLGGGPFAAAEEGSLGASMNAATGGAADAIPGIETPFGVAEQSLDSAALSARVDVQSGAELWRIGTMGQSKAGEAQFWSLESPTTPGFAARYGIPPANVTNADFIESGTLKPGAPFVTRSAPAVGASPGGGIEVVVNPGDVQLTGFSAG